MSLARRIWRVIGSALVGILVLAPAFVPVAAHAQAQEPDFAAIDAYVRAEMARAPIPGLAYGIVQGDQILHLQAFGAADASGRPVTPETPFVISSVTKTFTALAIRQQVNAGKLDVDAPVQRYLPWFRVADPEESAQITVRMLLEHTSGFSTQDGNQPYLDDPQYTTEDLVRRCATIELQHPPGFHEYSNINYLVLGAVLETATGQPYDEYVQRNIFTPLGMDHSYTSQTAAQQAGLAAGHHIWYGLPLPLDRTFSPAMHPAGYLMSSAEDLAHYLTVYYTGGRYGATSVLVPSGMPAPPAPPALTVYDGYWQPMRGPARPDWLWNQQGGSVNYNSDLMLAQAQQIGVVVLVNSRPDALVPAPNAYDIALGVMRLLQGQPPPAPAGLDYRSIWLLLDGALLLLLAFAVAQVLRLPRWGQATSLLGISVSVLLDLAPAMLILFALPASLQIGWVQSLAVIPELAYPLGGSALVLLGVGLVKILLMLSRVRIARHRLVPAPVHS